ncbi:MAG: hypothetical protein ACYTAF_13230 [Planctomycetota bacterium]|jgi:hypothetical protein
MYIKNRQDALDVLSEVLELPTRTEQIVSLTVKIVLCLDHDARSFLADCQSSLIEGGLDHMRQKRQQTLAEAGEDLIVVVESGQNELFEEVASTYDALRVADIVREVFPDLAESKPRWLIGRAVLHNEDEMRECLRGALLARNEKTDPDQAADIRTRAAELIEQARPQWIEHAEAMQKACLDVVTGAEILEEEDRPGYSDFLFNCIALNEHRADLFKDWIDNEPQAVVEFVMRLHEMSEAALQLETKMRQRKSDTA